MSESYGHPGFTADMLHFILQLLRGSSLDLAMGLLILSVCAMSAALVGWLCWAAIDQAFVPRERVAVSVLAKRFIPARVTTSLAYNDATKTYMPMATSHPDAWEADVALSGKTATVQVSKEVHDAISPGSQARADCGFGRLSGALVADRVSAS